MEKQEAALNELLRDVEAELDMTRAVLLYQEEAEGRRGAAMAPASSSGAPVEVSAKDAAASLDASPRGILRGNHREKGEKVSHVPTTRSIAATAHHHHHETFASLNGKSSATLRDQAEPDPIAPSHQGTIKQQHKQQHQSRMKSWSRSSSQRADETPSRSESRATTTTLYAEDDAVPTRHDLLDTPQQSGAPPSTSTLWRSPVSNHNLTTPQIAMFSPPRMVTLAPRNFTRDHAALQETRELLQRLDDDEQMMADDDEQARVVQLAPRGLEGFLFAKKSASNPSTAGGGNGQLPPPTASEANVYAPAVVLTRPHKSSVGGLFASSTPSYATQGGLTLNEDPHDPSEAMMLPSGRSRSQSSSAFSDTAAPTTATSNASTWFRVPQRGVRGRAISRAGGQQARSQQHASSAPQSTSVRDRLSKLQSKLTASVAETQ